MPFFAISNQFLNNLYSSYYKRIMLLDKFASFVLQFQHKLYFIVMSLARFNLYANSYVFLAKRAFAGKRDRGGKWTFWLEVFCLILFWAWYIPVLKGTGSWKNALAYLFITNMVPSPLHVQVLYYLSWCHTKTGLRSIVDRPLPLQSLNNGSWTPRIVPSSSASDDYRCHLPGLPRLFAWRAPSPSHPPSVSAPTSTQLTSRQFARQGVCEGTGPRVCGVWFYQRKWRGPWSSKGRCGASTNCGDGRKSRSRREIAKRIVRLTYCLTQSEIRFVATPASSTLTPVAYVAQANRG